MVAMPTPIKNRLEYMSKQQLIHHVEFLEEKISVYSMSLEDYAEALDQIQNIANGMSKSDIGQRIDEINNIISEVHPNE